MFDTRVPLNRLEKTVQEYEAAPIQTGKILFYGDSTFTRWSTKYNNRPVETEILGKDGSQAIINHGFGGSTAEELLFYYSRLVLPWKPRVLVLKAFGNDTAFCYSPSEILYLQSRILDHARIHMPGIRFYLSDVSVRIRNIDDDAAWHTFELCSSEYNSLLEDYCRNHKDCTYVCHRNSPLFFANPQDVGDYRKVRRDIFIEDCVHFNQTGYDLYREFYRQILDNVL